MVQVRDRGKVDWTTNEVACGVEIQKKREGSNDVKEKERNSITKRG